MDIERIQKTTKDKTNIGLSYLKKGWINFKQYIRAQGGLFAKSSAASIYKFLRISSIVLIKGIYSVLFLLFYYSKLALSKIFYVFKKRKLSLLKIAAYSMFLGVVMVGGLFIYYSKDLPSPEAVGSLFIPESTKILDRTESTVLYDIHGEEKRTIISFDEMPDYIKWATITAEDENFYHHPGIDIQGIFRAVVVNIKTGEKSQGGSTITQQFIKNAFLTPKKAFSRKIKEAILAIEMELKYSKDEILALYLNQVPYGGNTYGIEAAAKTYFDKPAKDLTLSESVTLASITQAPTYYTNNPQALNARKNFILRKMNTAGYISEEEYKIALEEDTELNPVFSGFEAPHFVIEVKKYLENKYGPSFVQQAGLRVVTTLDTSIQKAAEGAVLEYTEKNRASFNSNNTAVVVVDPHTGQTLGMVGSRDYFGESYPENCISGQNCLFDPQVNVAVTPQQPGSSFKPFAYAAAFEKGYTPNTTIYDVRTEFNTNCSSSGYSETSSNGSRCYNPQNYDLSYFGPMPLKEALAQSRNIPAVKVLYLAGIDNTIRLANKMGIDSLNTASDYGLALVLGGGDVTLLEETSAYGVFAARGEKNKNTFILKVEDKDGNVLEEYRKDPVKVINPNIADQITHSLSTNEFRSRVFGQRNFLNIPGLSVAAKTGTTQDYRDAWTVGYTPSLSVGVWTGNNDNSPMRSGSGSTVASPIWNSVIRNIYSAKSSEPQELKEKEFYFSLPSMQNEGKFTSPKIPTTGKGVLDGSILPHSILHYVSVNNPTKDAPKDLSQEPQYFNWESAVKNWLKDHGADIGIDDNENTTGPLVININNPQNKTYSEEEFVTLSGSVSSSHSLRNITVSLDGKVIINRSFHGEGISAFNMQENIGYLEEGYYTLIVYGEDHEDNNISRTINFTVEESESEQESEDEFIIPFSF